MKKLAKDKHSSLLQKFVTYGRKKFYNIGPRDQIWAEFSSLEVAICMLPIYDVFE